MVVRWQRYFPAVSQSLHRFHGEGFSLQLLEAVVRDAGLVVFKLESQASAGLGQRSAWEVWQHDCGPATKRDSNYVTSLERVPSANLHRNPPPTVLPSSLPRAPADCRERTRELPSGDAERRPVPGQPLLLRRALRGDVTPHLARRVAPIHD